MLAAITTTPTTSWFTSMFMAIDTRLWFSKQSIVELFSLDYVVIN